MNIGIFARKYPVLSQTFVVKQFESLSKLENVIMLSNDIDSIYRNENIKEFGNVSNSNKGKFFELLTGLMTLSVKGELSFIYKLLFRSQMSYLDKLRAINIKKSNVTLKLDFILVHFGPNGVFIKELIDLKLIDSKLAVIFHGYDLSRYSVMENYNLGYKKLFSDNSVICLPVSDFWKKKLIELGCGHSNIFVNRMGIDPNQFTYSPSQIGSSLRVIQIGRLTEKKSILDTIRAVIEARRYIDITLDVVGDGELYQAAMDLVSVNNAEGYIVLHGSVPHDDVQGLLKKSNLYILPSKRADDGDMEGIPVALMEAMASGVVVLSTYHSGIPELVIDQETGFLCNPGSVDEIKEAFLAIESLPPEYIRNIQDNARNKVLNDYDITKNSKELIGYLND